MPCLSLLNCHRDGPRSVIYWKGGVTLTPQMEFVSSLNSTKCCLKIYLEYLLLSRRFYKLEELPNFCLTISVGQFSFSHLNILIQC